MGVVWRATDLLLDRVVALKQVRLAGMAADDAEAARGRVMREARVAARLHHPNAVTIFDVVDVDGEPWLVLEFVPSRSLAEVLDEQGPLPPAAAARIGAAVADALAAAHAAGIVHRDVKPANILLGDSGAVKLTDFGISRLTGDLSLTASGLVIGTPAYLAPEVVRGAAAGAASDVFGLGATLYAAVEGAPPWGSGADLFPLLLAAGEGRVPPPRRAGALTGPLQRLLDAEPSRRPSAPEARDLLGEVISGRRPMAAPATLIGSGPPSPPPVTAARSHRRPLIIGAAVLSVLVLAGALVLAMRPTATPTAPAVASPAAPVVCDRTRGNLVIGMIAPLTGTLADLGVGMRNSAALAIEQANTRCAVPGHRLVLRAVDDQLDPTVAARAATELAADPTVVGVVGTLTSATGQAVQPILDKAGIVQISPGNTNPILTLGPAAQTAPSRPYRGYFRTIANDLSLGPFAAEYLVGPAGRRTIAVVDDGKTYGRTLADAFSSRVTALGATVVAREQVQDDDRDFGAVIGRIAAKRPDAVFYGGEFPAAAPLSAQLAAAGLAVPLVGGDGLVGTQYVALGGRPGDLAAVIGGPPSNIPSATQFVADYSAAGYPESATNYGVTAYDSVTVIVRALGGTLAGNGSGADPRSGVIAAVQATDVDGAGGHITFDAFGDTTNQLITIYTVQGDAFAPVPGWTRSLVR